MKQILSFLFVAISLIASSQTPCKVTYISNEGFLIEINHKKILVDGLFEHIDENWCDSPSEDNVKLMKKSEGIFNNIDLIAITHQHRDHFNEQIVIEHLKNNLKAKVICPIQVDNILKSNPSYNEFQQRIFAITPDMYKDSSLTIDGIPIRILRLEHSHTMKYDEELDTIANKHRNIENIGFLFNINGKKIFHCGDTNPLNEIEYTTFNLQNEKIDIAFIERLFFAYEKTNIISDYIKAKNLVVMHINPENKKLYMDYLKAQKNIKIFENKMESYKLNL